MTDSTGTARWTVAIPSSVTLVVRAAPFTQPQWAYQSTFNVTANVTLHILAN